MLMAPRLSMVICIVAGCKTFGREVKGKKLFQHDGDVTNETAFTCLTIWQLRSAKSIAMLQATRLYLTELVKQYVGCVTENSYLMCRLYY